MFTLIKREILDHIIYFIIAAFLAAIFVIISISIASQYESLNKSAAFTEKRPRGAFESR